MCTGGEMIAVREYALDGQKGAVRVELHAPIKTPAHDDFCCSFRLLGLGADLSSHACGIDPLQALTLALTKIGAVLYSSEEWRDGRLTWLGQPRGDLGLPVPTSMGHPGADTTN